MATESIISLKHIDVTVTIPQNGSFTSVPVAINRSRIKSAFLLYSDPVYFYNPILAISGTDGSNAEVAIKTTSAVSSSSDFVVRVFYE